MSVRLILALLGAVGLLASAGGSAEAGTYDLRSCGASSALRADAWVPTGGTARTEFGNTCGGGGTKVGLVDFHDARWFRPNLSGANDPGGRVGGFVLSAPAGSEIRGITYSRALDTMDDVRPIRLLAQPSGQLLDLCQISGFEEHCADAVGDTFATTAIPAGTTSLDLGVYCEQAFCGYGTGPLYDFAIAIYSSVVTIEENTPPAAGAVTTSAGPSGWMKGDGTISFSGSDALGVRRFEVLEGDQVLATVARTCVDWSVLPCSEPAAGLSTSASGSVVAGTLGLIQGEHSLRVRVTDGAGNTSLSAPATIKLDVTPWSMALVDGYGASAAASRELTWTPAGSGAPVVAASARICTSAGGCTDQSVSPNGPVQLQLPEVGSTATVAVTLTDAAGNALTSQAYPFSRTAPTPTPAVTPTPGPGPTLSATTAPVPTATPAMVPTPTPTPAPAAAPKALNLTLKVTSNLRKRRITLKGSVARGSTSRIDVQLIGKTARGKRVTRKARITVPANGRFTKRLQPPRGSSSRKPVQVVLTPRPNAGWRSTRYSNTIRP